MVCELGHKQCESVCAFFPFDNTNSHELLRMSECRVWLLWLTPVLKSFRYWALEDGDLCCCEPLFAALARQSARLFHLSCMSELYALFAFFIGSHFTCFHRSSQHPVKLRMSCQTSASHLAAGCKIKHH